MDFREKIQDDLEKEGVDTQKASVIDDLFIEKFIEFNQPVKDEVDDFFRRMNFSEFFNLDREEQLKFAENFFVEVDDGERASGPVRIIFEEPVDLEIPQGTIFISRNGSEYQTTEDFQITRQNIMNNTYGAYYFAEVDVEAVEDGEEYNISSEEINQCENTRVMSLSEDIYNPYPLEGGEGADSPMQLYQRIQDQISTRTLANRPSISSILRDNFSGNILDIYTVNAYSPEMLRDRVEIDGTEYRIGNKNDIWVYTHTTRDQSKSTEMMIGHETVKVEGDDVIIPFGYSDPLLPDDEDDEFFAYRHTADEDDIEEIKEVVTEVYNITILYDSGVENEFEDFEFIQETGHENSTRQQSVIRLKDFDEEISGNILVEYETDDIVPEIQDFVTDPSNRFPLGDPLAKHFIIYRLHGNIYYRGDVEEDELVEELRDYIRFYDYNPERTMEEIEDGAISGSKYIEKSDIINELYSIGVSKVNMNELDLWISDINNRPINENGEVIDSPEESFTDEMILRQYEIVLPGEINVVKEG